MKALADLQIWLKKKELKPFKVFIHRRSL